MVSYSLVSNTLAMEGFTFETPVVPASNETNETKEGLSRDELVVALASSAHDTWRAPRRIEGTDMYEPRVKPVKDEQWIADHGGVLQMDIANTPYQELPSEWQADNKASAEVATDAVLVAATNGRALDETFIEEVSATVHEKWLERNAKFATEEQKKPYAELSEEEKQKDREFVLGAIALYKERASK